MAFHRITIGSKHTTEQNSSNISNNNSQVDKIYKIFKQTRIIQFIITGMFCF